MYCAGENSSLLVALDFHGDFDDWVVVRTIPKQIPIFFCKGMREYDVLPVACRPRLLCVLVDFICASENGDVEVIAIRLTRSVVVFIGLIAFEVHLEIASHFSTFSHLEAFVEGWVHSKSILDVDNAIGFFLHQFVFSNRLGVVVVEVSPISRHAIGPNVHRGVVSVGLFWIFSRFLLHDADITGLNRSHQQCNHNQAEKGFASHG